MRYALIILSIAIIPAVAAADSSSTVQLPANFTSLLVAQVSDLIGNFSGLIILISSVLLAAVVIEIIIGALRHRG